MFVTVSGLELLCCAMVIELHATSLAPVVLKPVHRYSARDALIAIPAVWSVSIAATTPVSQFDQLAVQLHVHRYPWIGHKISCRVIRQIAAIVLFREIQTDVQ
jgi:hypothetical protein